MKFNFGGKTMYLFLESAAGTTAAGSSASMILMFVVLIAVFYFFMIRPENKRRFLDTTKSRWKQKTHKDCGESNRTDS